MKQLLSVNVEGLIYRLLIISFAIFLTVNALALGAFEMRFNTWAHVLPVTLILFLATIGSVKYKGRSLRRPDDKTSVLILTFMGLAFLSCFNGVYPFAAFLRFKSLLAVFIFFWAVFAIIVKEPSKNLVAGVLIASGTVVATIGLLQYLGAIHGPWPVGGLGLRAPFMNHNHLAGYLEMIIPLGFAMLFSSLKPALKLVIGYGTFIMLVTHVLSLSRGGWISLAFSLAIFFVLTFASGKRKLVAGLLGLFSLILLLALYQIGEEPIDERLNQLAGVTVEKEQSGRLAIFKSAIDMGLDSPLRGVGIGQFRHNYIHFRSPMMTSLPRFAHNDYLHVFAELGLPGFVIILVLAWLIVSKGLNQFHSHLHLGAICGVIAILVHSMVDFNLHLSSNALLFAFLTAICLSDKSFKIHSKFVVPIGAAVLIALVVIVPRHLTLKETGNLLERGRAYIDTKEYSKAITCFSKASVLSPQIAEIFRDLAYSKFQCGKLAAILGLKGKAIGFLEAAIGDYQSALKLNSNDAFVIHWQGICQSEITKITRKHESAVAAINYFRRAHKLDPLNVVYTRWLGTHLMVIGEEDEAMTVLSDLTHNPTTTPSFVNRMLSFTYIYLTDSERIKKKVRLIEDARLAEKEGLALKGTPDAEKTPAQEVSLLVMAKLIKLVPENSEGALLHLAGLYMKDGNWIEARKLYQRALIVAPLSRQVLKSLGAAAMSNDDLELAEKTYTKLLSVWNDYWVSNQLAAVARKRKDTVSEEKWLARGIELAPDQPRPFLAMALFLTRSGDEEKKKKGIEKLQAMSLTYRDFYEAPWHLGLIANSDKDYYRAIEYFTIALKRAPDNVTIKNVMAWTYVRTGLAIKGYRIWDKAIVDHPERFDLILNKASAHYGQREYAHTVECLKEYKKFVPSGKFNGKPLDDEIARISALIKTVERW